MPGAAITLVLPLLAAAALLAGPHAVQAQGQAQEIPVDLELVLAVDVSRSMDADEQALQRMGYVAALTHPDVIAAVVSGPRKRIALAYVEWAGPATQVTVVDWGLIDGEAAAQAFADALAAAPTRLFRGTSISDGLAYVQPMFEGNGFSAPRRVIDVSGDGPNNMGLPVELARAAAVDAGITINGLPIMIKQPSGFAAIADLDLYYQDCVIGGFGAFIVVVRSPDQFAEAIRRKLVLEIAGTPPPPPEPTAPLLIPATQTAQQTRIDCLIGEKLRQQWMRN